jgi:hypothetical protein
VAADSHAEMIYLSVWPRDVSPVVDAALEASALEGVDVSVIGRVGIGLLMLRIGAAERSASEGASALIETLRQKFADRIAVKAKGATNPWPIASPSLASMRAVKHALDPSNVLRGREVF